MESATTTAAAAGPMATAEGSAAPALTEQPQSQQQQQAQEQQQQQQCPTREQEKGAADKAETNKEHEEQQAGAGSASATPSVCGTDNSKEEDTDDDETEIVEESPCGRWLKRREEVKYRDVPGIDNAFLAMDAEEGVEVVWNEASFSTAKRLRGQEEKLKAVLDALTVIDHPNIVHFHKYWLESVGDKPDEKKRGARLIFITEYMSSGSLKQFLRRTKKNNRKIQLQSWRRWCTQILSALTYLHSKVEPAIVHGNLTCDTIFIQHNGLVKIGSVAPDIIYQNVKTYRDSIKNLHYLAPELGVEGQSMETQSDIYSFGMCALEMATLDLLGASQTPGAGGAAKDGNATSSTSQTAPDSAEQSTTAAGTSNTDNSTSGTSHGTESGNTTTTSSSIPTQTATNRPVTEEMIKCAIEQLEDGQQKEFIQKCLDKDPRNRPTARQLLFHPAVFEVHSLKLLAAHSLVSKPVNTNESMTEEVIQNHYGVNSIIATLQKGGETKEYRLSSVASTEKLEKFIEDVKVGIYPITAFAAVNPKASLPRAVTPEHVHMEQDVIKKSDGENAAEEEEDDETRRILQAWATIAPLIERVPGKEDIVFKSYQLLLLVRFEDGMNRRLDCPVEVGETPQMWVNELLGHKLVSEPDANYLLALLSEAICRWYKMVLSFVSAFLSRNGAPPHGYMDPNSGGVDSDKVQQKSSSGKSPASVANPEDSREASPLVAPEGEVTEVPDSIKDSAPKDEEAATETEKEKAKAHKLELKEQWLLEQHAVENYQKFPFFSHPDFPVTEHQAFSVAEARDIRDPLNITHEYPVPTGGFFCPPAPQDGVEPYREIPPGNNAFDFRHLEGQNEHTTSSSGMELQPKTGNGKTECSTTPAPPSQGTMNMVYDPYAYLQGAQKVLEDLSSGQKSGQLQQEEPGADDIKGTGEEESIAEQTEHVQQKE